MNVTIRPYYVPSFVMDRVEMLAEVIIQVLDYIIDQVIKPGAKFSEKHLASTWSYFIDSFIKPTTNFMWYIVMCCIIVWALPNLLQSILISIRIYREVRKPET